MNFFKFYRNSFLLIVIFVFILQSIVNGGDINPYKILGIDRNADEKTIRNAYRKLAKEWHPDKNKSPEAHEKFMLINKAYEILADSERRSLYDEYGTTNEPREGGDNYHRQNFDHFFRDFDGFDGFFGGGGFRFNGGNERARKSQEEEINKRIYEETIFPNSHIKPFIIYFYTEFCFSCFKVEGIWQQFKQEVKGIGIGAGHSDASWNRELSKSFGINQVPAVVAIVNGRVRHYRGEYTLKNLREFTRNLIPTKLITDLNENNFNETLQQTLRENKVQAVFLSTSNQISLRYQMPCFQTNGMIKCSAIKKDSLNSNFKTYLQKNHKVNVKSIGKEQEMLLIFKENLQSTRHQDDFSHEPVVMHKMDEISYSTIQQTFELNKSLYFARLSSNDHFEEICKVSQFNSNNNEQLCVIFLSNSQNQLPQIVFHNDLKTRLIQNAENDEFLKQYARFAYIYTDVQVEFMEKLMKNSKIKSIENNKVLFLKRMDDMYVQFDWLDVRLDSLDCLQTIKIHLRSYVSAGKNLNFKARVPNLYEESTQSLIANIIEQLELIRNYLSDWHFWLNIINNNSYLMIILCTFMFVWLIFFYNSEPTLRQARQFNRRDSNVYDESQNEPSSYSNQAASKNSSHHASFASSNESATADTSIMSDYYNINTSNEFEVIEMSKNNYSSLFWHIPKGYRTILIIVNNENKNQLVDLFTKVCSKYYNKTYHLRFAYLNRDSYLGQKWFNHLMLESFKESSEDSSDSNEDASSNDSEFEQIGSKKKAFQLDSDCLVLAISPLRKYYSMLKLNSEKTSSYLDIKTKNQKVEPFENSVGFEERISIQDERKFILKLSNWLDKFTEGLCSEKIFVKDWPTLD